MRLPHRTNGTALAPLLRKWGDYPLEKVWPMPVQPRLKCLDLALRTKGHIREVMHRLFEKAMLWELVPFQRNPYEHHHLLTAL
jgi:hypothetical protein